MTVVRTSPVPLYVQIEDEIRKLIRTGQLQPLDRVPSEFELSDRFGVSRMTARKSLDGLVSEGMLFRRAGKGTYVAASKISHTASTRMSFSQAMRSLGLEHSTRVLDAGLAEAPANAARALRVPPGSSVAFVRRLRSVGGEPAAIHESVLPPHLADVLEGDLTGSLNELMLRAGAPVVSTHDWIEAVSASGDSASLLGVRPGTALIRIEGIGLSAGRVPLRYTEALYRGDRFRFGTSPDAPDDLRMEVRDGGRD